MKNCIFQLIFVNVNSTHLRSSSMSRTLARRLLHAFSFSCSSFILLFMVIVFRVIFFPGLLILSSQGSHCKNTLFTWDKQKQVIKLEQELIKHNGIHNGSCCCELRCGGGGRTRLFYKINTPTIIVSSSQLMFTINSL